MLAYNPCAVSNGRPPPKSSTGMASATTTLSLKKSLKSVTSHADEVCDSRAGRLKTSSSFVEKVKHLFPGVTTKIGHKTYSERVRNDISNNQAILRTKSFSDKNGDISRSSVASMDSLCSDRTTENPLKCSTLRGSQRGISQPSDNTQIVDFSFNPRTKTNPPTDFKKDQKLRKRRFRRRSSLDENILSIPGKFPFNEVHQDSDFKVIRTTCFNICHWDFAKT